MSMTSLHWALKKSLQDDAHIVNDKFSDRWSLELPLGGYQPSQFCLTLILKLHHFDIN